MQWTDAQFQMLKDLIAQRLSARQIGKELGVSRNAVIGKVHRGGLTLSKRQGPPAAPAPRKPRPPQPRTKPPSSIALPAEEEIDPAVVSFAELAAHHCRWPVGDCYCGAAAVAGSSYCRRHTVIAHHRRVPA
jgi:GcrA cell cycle regulator